MKNLLATQENTSNRIARSWIAAGLNSLCFQCIVYSIIQWQFSGFLGKFEICIKLLEFKLKSWKLTLNSWKGSKLKGSWWTSEPQPCPRCPRTWRWAQDPPTHRRLRRFDFNVGIIKQHWNTATLKLTTHVPRIIFFVISFQRCLFQRWKTIRIRFLDVCRVVRASHTSSQSATTPQAQPRCKNSLSPPCLSTHTHTHLLRSWQRGRDKGGQHYFQSCPYYSPFQVQIQICFCVLMNWFSQT